MARAIAAPKLTTADDLREALATCERQLVDVRGSGASAIDLLERLDSIAMLVAALEAGGMDLRAEHTRWSSLQASVKRRSTQIVKEARAVGGLAEARALVQPPRSAWWWFLDEDVRSERRRRTRRLLVGAGLVLVVGTVLVLLYQRFLAPDPATVRVYELQLDGEMLAREGDLGGALNSFEEALQLRPEVGDLLVWRGVLQEVLGDADRAATDFDRARALLEDDESFWMLRGQVYMELGRYEQAQDDAMQVLEGDPGSPDGYFLMGSVFEAQGQFAEAAAAYERASSAADERGNDRLQALARMRLATVLQQGAFGGGF